MSNTDRSGDRIRPAADAQIGGDAPGVAQTVTAGTVTQAEIDELASDTTMPIEERRARLEAVASQLGAQGAVDRGGEFRPFEAQIDEALSLLAEGGHAYATTDAAGLDPDGRSGARAPDDDPELR